MNVNTVLVANPGLDEFNIGSNIDLETGALQPDLTIWSTPKLLLNPCFLNDAVKPAVPEQISMQN